jgi:hypothetical protein
MSPTDEARDMNLDEGLEDMAARARDKMKGKTLGDNEGEKKGCRVSGQETGSRCGALRVRERQHQPRGLNAIGSEDRALRRV